MAHNPSPTLPPFPGSIPRQTQLWLVALVLLAALWRLPGLFANTFHPDEALFASWARLIAIWRDPWLQTQLVDKPPLAFYLQAAFYPLLGSAPYAARLPNFIASLLLLPALAQWLWHLYQDELTVRVAVILLAFSPLAIQSSATAFLDPLLLALLLAALWAQAASGAGRPLAAGLLFGLALLTKYQALRYLPLVLGQGWAADDGAVADGVGGDGVDAQAVVGGEVGAQAGDHGVGRRPGQAGLENAELDAHRHLLERLGDAVPPAVVADVVDEDAQDLGAAHGRKSKRCGGNDFPHAPSLFLK